jgi:hypothetical protein
MVPTPPNIKSKVLSVEDRQVYLVGVACSHITRTTSLLN